MKNIFKKVALACLLAGASIGSLASCGDDTKKDNSGKPVEVAGYTFESVDPVNAKFVKSGKLTVGMSTDFAPMEFIDTTKTGQDMFAGTDVTFSKALAACLGLELEIKAIGFDVLLTSLDSNIIDIAISGFSYTDDRAASYLFTDEYYNEGDGGQVLVIKNSDAAKYTTLESLNSSNVKVAVQASSLQYDLVMEQLPNSNHQVIQDLNTAYSLLESGSYDAVAVAKSVAETLIAKNSALAIVPEQFVTNDEGNYALLKKTNTTLAPYINEVIAQVKEQGAMAVWNQAAKNLFLNLGDNAGELIPDETETPDTTDQTTGA